MNNRSKYLIKNVGILTISNFASKILVFLLVPLYTSVLSTEDVGIYDIVVSTIALLFPLLTLNIIDSVMRFLMDDYSKSEVASIGIKFILFSNIPVLFFLLIISKNELIPRIHGYESIIFVYYMVTVFNQYSIQFAKGMEMVTDLGVSGVLSTIVMLTCNIVFLLVLKLGLRGFFFANISSQLVSLLYLLLRTKTWYYWKLTSINISLQKEMLKYCLPLIVTAIGWWMNNAADKYVVTFICGMAANGILSVSYKIPAILNTVQSIFTQAWQISAIKEYGEEDTSIFYGKTFIVLNFIMSIGCSVLILLAKPIGHILYKNEFYVAWRYVPFLIISSVVNCASGVLGPILSAKKASNLMALSAIYGAVFNLIFNFCLVYLMGIQGATIATLISSFVIYYIRKRSVGADITIPQYSAVIFTWIMLCVQAVAEIYTSYFYINIIVLIIIIFINLPIVLRLIPASNK